MLVEHGIDNVDESFVAREEPVSSCKQISLKPSLAHVFAQHFCDAPFMTEVFIDLKNLLHPLFIGCLIQCLKSIRCSLVRAENAEVPGIQILLHHVAQEDAHHARGLR